MSAFWLGFVTAIAVVISIPLLILIVAREYRAWYLWFKGLPIFQYPAMLMLVLAAKIINVEHCMWMNYDNRVWMSPKVRGFNLEDKIRKEAESGSK